jgi:hypothetical protein
VDNSKNKGYVNFSKNISEKIKYKFNFQTDLGFLKTYNLFSIAYPTTSSTEIITFQEALFFYKLSLPHEEPETGSQHLNQYNYT